MSRDNSIDAFKGLAIIAVIFIHLVAYFLNANIVSTFLGQKLLFFDQFLRFSVPVFVALSGYGLAKKYQIVPFDLMEFLKSRIGKIIPLFLFWIAIVWAATFFVPGWAGFMNSFPLWQRIFLGRADYQLYFVPMIVTLYLLFPVLLLIVRKFSLVAVGLALLVQIWLYWFIGSVVVNDQTVGFLQTDQQQYVFFLSWIFYFVLGIYLARFEIKKNLLISIVLLFVTGVLLYLTFIDARSLVTYGRNLTFALRFTKISVVWYASAFLFTGLFFFKSVSLENLVGKVLVWSGKNSFVIFLSHTLALRIIFGYWFDRLSVANLLGPTVLFVLGVFVSLNFARLRTVLDRTRKVPGRLR